MKNESGAGYGKRNLRAILAREVCKELTDPTLNLTPEQKMERMKLLETLTRGKGNKPRQRKVKSLFGV
jgi:hypothetical protein